MNYPLGVAILGFAGNASLDEAVVDAHYTLRTMIQRLDGAQLGSRLEQLTSNYEPDDRRRAAEPPRTRMTRHVR